MLLLVLQLVPLLALNDPARPSHGDGLFYVIGRGIMNRSDHQVGSDLSKDQRFREFFGCSSEVALIMWNLLIKHLLLPDEAQIVHLLWALFFM